jgi:hypothetical protein
MSDEATSAVAEAPAAEAAPAETTLVTAPAAESEAPNGEAEAEAEAGGETEAGQVAEEAAAETETEEAKPEGAPEQYAEFTMPEGVVLDPELTDQFKATAKELNLTQDQAQKVAELGAQMRQRDAEAIVAIRADWVNQTKSDPELGGANLDATLGVARKAVDAYGSDSFKQFLNESGLGNHPEVVRFMAKVGKTVAEDRVVTGNGTTTARAPSTTTERLAGRLYGSDKE